MNTIIGFKPNSRGTDGNAEKANKLNLFFERYDNGTQSCLPLSFALTHRRNLWGDRSVATHPIIPTNVVDSLNLAVKNSYICLRHLPL